MENKADRQHNVIVEGAAGVEEALIEITRKEEESRLKKQSAADEAKAMVEKARRDAREREISDKARRDEIFKQETRKFATESRQKAAEYLEAARQKNEDEIISPARNKIKETADFLLESFLSLEWFK